MQLAVDTNSRSPIYQQLVQQIREGIARGDLQPQGRLPSVRELSRQLVVNPNTIARAYSQLEREGLVVSRPGLGIFVARVQPELTRAGRERRLRATLDQLLTQAVHLGFSAEEVVEQVKKRVSNFQWQQTQARQK